MLSYVELTTSGAPQSAKLPLLIALHGHGATPQQLAGPLLHALNGAVSLRLVLPQAPHRVPGRGFSWFDGVGRLREQRRAALSVKKLAKRVQEARPTLGEPVVLGFSQGGMIAFDLATRTELCLALPISGVPSQPTVRRWPRRGCAVPVLALHGRADSILPLNRTLRRMRAIRRRQRGPQKCAMSLLTFPVGHEVATDMLVVVRRILAASTATGDDGRQGCPSLVATAAGNLSGLTSVRREA